MNKANTTQEQKLTPLSRPKTKKMTPSHSSQATSSASNSSSKYSSKQNKSIPTSVPTSSHQHHTSSPQKQYYLIQDTVSEKPNNNYAQQSWQEPFIIEDEDLMFNGTPLNELHEMDSRMEEELLRSRRSSGESERSVERREEMTRGRQRDRF